MIALWIGLAAALAWAVLLAGRGGFWLARERDDAGPTPPDQTLARWPAVVAVVPARDEADVVEHSIGSLLRQDYPGPFQVVLVDDGSGDGTAALPRRAGAAARGPHGLEVLQGAPLPGGWTGKLWAVSQGVAHAEATATPPAYLWLTDADIAHAPDNLRRLVARAEPDRLVLTSQMAELTVQTWPERLLIPAFVLFFAMLYPFAWANDPRRRTAAAAGGSMLVRREALAAAGGIEAIRAEIIDDCALAARMKRQGPIRLTLTRAARSLRPYQTVGEIGRMVSRSAYAQLGFNPLILLGMVAAMALIWLAGPLLAVVASGPPRLLGLGAWLAMAVAFQPMLRFYRLGPAWGVAAPLIALLYTGFTVASAIQHGRGRGGQWKGRAQALARSS